MLWVNAQLPGSLLKGWEWGEVLREISVAFSFYLFICFLLLVFLRHRVSGGELFALFRGLTA